MREPIVIRLTGEPVGKGRPRFVRKTGRAFTPAATRSYESHLRLAAQDEMDGEPLLEGPLAVSVLAIFPVPTSWSKKKRAAALAGEIRPTTTPDADNLLKVLDAFNEVVWRDDKQIVEAAISKRYGPTPQLAVRVAPLELATALPAPPAAERAPSLLDGIAA